MHLMNRLVVGVAFATALAAGAAAPLGGAQAATLINGSFEEGIDPGSFTTIYSPDSSSITGWKVVSGNIDYIGSYWNAADGSRSLDMNGFDPGSISQTITGLTSGQQYKVSFDLAGNPDAGPTTKTLDAITASAGTNSFSFSTIGKSKSNMGWVTESFYFTATGPNELLTFASTVTSGGTPENPAAFGPALDNVSVTATPLPAAFPLFAAGLGAMGLLGWRRKRKASGIVAA